MGHSLKSPIMLALDIDDPKQALRFALEVGTFVGAIKIGPRLALRTGPSWMSEMNSCAPIFLDHKFLDIPSTMESAVRTTFELGAAFTTVHAWAGKEALKRLAHLEIELNQVRPFKILVVTILTSFSLETLPFSTGADSIDRQVQDLASMSLDCGLKGFVCSPHEAAIIRTLEKSVFIITPGIRFDDQVGHANDDQSRVMSPSEALKAGANAIVIGRPIMESKNPKALIDSLNKSFISDGLWEA